MGVVNFAHGAFYTLGAFAALLGLQFFGINYWRRCCSHRDGRNPRVVVERLLLRHIYRLEPLYGLLLTFGLALAVEGTLFQLFGSSANPIRFRVPARRRQSRLHDPADLPRLGHRRLRHRLHRTCS